MEPNDRNDTNRRALASVDHSTPLKRGSTNRALEVRLADHRDLEPVSKIEFATELAPALTLVAPVGMTNDDRKAWYAVAYVALDGIPIALLRRGVAEAMLVADHPAKLVPAIAKAIRDDWDRRKRIATPVEIHVTPPDPLRLGDNSIYTLDEVRALSPMVRNLGVAGGWIRPEDVALLATEESQANG